jgi:hypothetical protein
MDGMRLESRRMVIVMAGWALAVVACGGPSAPGPPATPTGLTAEPRDGAVLLTWSASAGPDVRGYNVHWGLTSGTLDETAFVAAPTTTHTVTGLTNGVAYYFAVDAEDGAGRRSPRSAAVLATPSAASGGPPSITATGPAPGGAGIPVNTNVDVTFSQAMNRSATEAAFGSEPALACGFSWHADGTTLRCTPSGTLTPATTYRVTIDTGAENLSGVPLERAFVFSFTTGAAADTTPPSIIAANPGDGAAGVPRNAAVAVTFSEAMSRAATEAAFSTVPGIDCAFSWSIASTNLSCRPTSELAANTSYEVTVGAGAQDLAGNALETPFRFTFTTSESVLPVCAFDAAIATFGNCVFGP